MASNHDDNTAPPPQYTEKASLGIKPVNILVVGESQQGKSSLIKSLTSYAGLPESDIGIGTGNLACTKIVKQYEIPTVLRKFKLADPGGHALPKLSYSALCALGPEDAQVLTMDEDADHPIDKEVINFSFIDTPGLDDSDGQDFEIMADIIGRVGQLDHINAVIYVRSTNKAFGRSFHQFFNYIQRSMPTLSNGLVIVHSHFSVEDVEQFASENKDLAAIRRDAVLQATKLELPHFFMDNEPSEYSPFAVLQSLNEIHRFLSHLKSQAPLPVAGLKLLKTNDMQQTEIHVIQALTELRNRLDHQWNIEKSHARVLEQNVMSATRAIARIDSRIADAKATIAELEGGSDIVLGTKSVVKDYSLLTNLLVKGEVNLGYQDVAYDSDCPIAYVTKSAGSGSQWLSEDLRGTSWRASITAGWFRDISGSATFYAKAAKKHRTEIKALKERVKDLEEQLAENRETIRRNGGTQAGDAGEKTSGQMIEGCDALVELLKRETCEIRLYPALKRYYIHQGKLSRDDIRDFVQVLNPTLSDLL